MTGKLLLTTPSARMTLAIRRLRRILDTGDEIRRETEKGHNANNSDRDHSETWKAGQRDRLNATAQRQYKDLAKLVQEQINELKQARQDFAGSFDFTDPAFQNALFTIKTVGKKLPTPAQKAIADRFCGNPIALKSLKPLYEANTWSLANIDELLDVFTATDESLYYDCGYFVSLASDPHGQVPARWESGAIRRTLNRFEKGLRLDTSKNAHLAALEAYANDPGIQKHLRDRASRFIKNNAEELANDNHETLEKAAEKLASNFALTSERSA